MQPRRRARYRDDPDVQPLHLDDSAAPVAERKSQKRLLLKSIRQIPAFLRLLIGLMSDRRVAIVDKLLVAGAIAYVAMPADLLPDIVPFLGLVDDVFLLATTIRRLLRSAGWRVVSKYWRGNPQDLRTFRIEQIIAAASMFLPRRTRRRLSRSRARD